MGFIESPLRRHSRSCVHSHLDRRPGFGPGLPHPGRVPLLPFLPASAVSSAGVRSEDRTLERPAGLLHPAAGRGVRHVSDSRLASRPSVTRRSFRSLPQWRRPFEASSSPDSQTTSSPPAPCGACVHRMACPLAVGPPAPLSVSPRCGPVSSTSGPSSAGGARCQRAALPRHTARCSHGLWIDTIRCLPRAPRAGRPMAARSTRRHQTAPGVPPPESDEKAKILGFVWLRVGRCWDRPEGRPPAGPARWQPEDCYASGPARPDSRRSPTGIGRSDPDTPKGTRTRALTTPKGRVERR